MYKPTELSSVIVRDKNCPTQTKVDDCVTCGTFQVRWWQSLHNKNETITLSEAEKRCKEEEIKKQIAKLPKETSLCLYSRLGSAEEKKKDIVGVWWWKQISEEKGDNRR